MRSQVLYRVAQITCSILETHQAGPQKFHRETFQDQQGHNYIWLMPFMCAHVVMHSVDRKPGFLPDYAPA